MAILLALTAGQRCNDNSLVVRTAIGWMGAPWPMWYIRSHAHLLSMGAMTPRRGSMARFLRNAVPGISLDRAAQTSLS